MSLMLTSKVHIWGEGDRCLACQRGEMCRDITALYHNAEWTKTSFHFWKDVTKLGQWNNEQAKMEYMADVHSY